MDSAESSSPGSTITAGIVAAASAAQASAAAERRQSVRVMTRSTARKIASAKNEYSAVWKCPVSTSSPETIASGGSHRQDLAARRPAHRSAGSQEVAWNGPTCELVSAKSPEKAKKSAAS